LTKWFYNDIEVDYEEALRDQRKFWGYASDVYGVGLFVAGAVLVPEYAAYRAAV
jgi:hypothetical protein